MRVAGLLFESEDGRSRFLVQPHAPPVIVGRRPPFEPQNVRIGSVLVSRQHVRITPTAHGFTVEDAGSSGGAYLDGERFSGPAPIGPGARLQLNSELTFTARAFAGVDLTAWSFGRHPPLDVPGTLRLVRDVVLALRPLHAAGDVHGNLDPYHILLGDDAPAWTLLVDGWTMLGPDGGLMGNPVYAPPEVFDGHELVTASDFYTLGLLAFEVLYGHRPFPDDTPQDNIAHKLFGGAPDWRGRRLGDGIEDFFLRLLSLHPRDRPDVARALELIVELRPELRPEPRLR